MARRGSARVLGGSVQQGYHLPDKEGRENAIASEGIDEDAGLYAAPETAPDEKGICRSDHHICPTEERRRAGRND